MRRSGRYLLRLLRCGRSCKRAGNIDRNFAKADLLPLFLLFFWIMISRRNSPPSFVVLRIRRCRREKSFREF